MKIQRKLLTKEQKKAICEEYRGRRKYCKDGCPLTTYIGEEFVCCSPRFESIQDLEQAIKDYWDEEVEVKDEIFGDNSGT